MFFAAVPLPCFKTGGSRPENEAWQGPGDNRTASNEKLGWGLGTRLDVMQ